MWTAFILSLVMVCACSGQQLPGPQSAAMFQKVMQALTNGSNETTSNNETGTEIPATIKALIGFLATRGNTLNGNTGSRSSYPTLATPVPDEIQAENDNVTNSFRNSTDGDNLFPDHNKTVGLDVPEDIGTQTINTETSSLAHSETSHLTHEPNVDVSSAVPSEPQGSPQQNHPAVSPEQKNPTIEQMEEPVEPPTGEKGQGSLPLVLGAAIVVIFGVGVAGAAISSMCKRRKIAASDSTSVNSSEIEIERGIDNPMFISDSKKSLHSFPSNTKLHQMRYTSSTVPLY